MILDSKRIEDLRSIDDDGSEETLRELVRIYLKASEKKINELRNIPETERRSIRLSAHALRSSSLNMGVVSIAELSKKIEYEDLGSLDLENTIKDLIKASDEVKQAFRELKLI